MSSLLPMTTHSSPSPPPKGTACWLCCSSVHLQIISLFPFAEEGVGHVQASQSHRDSGSWTSPLAGTAVQYIVSPPCPWFENLSGRAGALRGDGTLLKLLFEESVLAVHPQLSSALIHQLTAGPCHPHMAPLQELQIDKTKGEKPTEHLKQRKSHDSASPKCLRVSIAPCNVAGYQPQSPA